MAIRSLKQTMDRMRNEKRMAGTGTDFSSLAKLRITLDTMYQIRANTSGSMTGGIPNRCTEHYYADYPSFQRSISLTGSEASVGDYNNALDEMAYCSCNARQTQQCDCVTRQNSDFCKCNYRNPLDCECVSRSSGKYSAACNCDTRYAGAACTGHSFNYTGYSCTCQNRTTESPCDCVTRNSSINCSCNGRCNCNSVNEYTVTAQWDMDAACTCVARQYGDQCGCNARIYDSTVNIYCDCQNRTTKPGDCWLNQIGNNGDDWGAKICSTVSACTCNTRLMGSPASCDCVQRTSSALCQCNVRKA